MVGDLNLTYELLPIAQTRPFDPRLHRRARHAERNGCSCWPACADHRRHGADDTTTTKDCHAHRTLGQGLEVSAIGLGAMGMSQSYGPNPGDRATT